MPFSDWLRYSLSIRQCAVVIKMADAAPLVFLRVCEEDLVKFRMTGRFKARVNLNSSEILVSLKRG